MGSNQSLFYFIFLCALLNFVSCRSRTEKEKNFEVVLSIRTNKSDIIKFYYLYGDEMPYSEKHMQKSKVLGKEEFQEIAFSLKRIPSTFRIDLGESGYLDTLEIGRINIKSEEKEILILSEEIHRFFKINIYLEQYGSNFVRNKVGIRYDPFIESTALLQKKIELEF